MKENEPIRSLLSKLSIRAIWGIISSIVIVVSGAISAGYELGSLYYATTICHVEICDKEKIIDQLSDEKSELKNELGKCRILVFTLQQKDKKLEPILRLLLENYESSLDDTN